MSSFPARLKECRKIKNVTQRDVAEFLCIATGAYQRYELGTREPNHENTIKLADFFQVSTDYLLGRDFNPPPRQ